MTCRTKWARPPHLQLLDPVKGRVGISGNEGKCLGVCTTNGEERYGGQEEGGEGRRYTEV